MPFDGTSFLKELEVKKEIELSPVTKLLIDGRNRIERGWCQGAFKKPRPFPYINTSPSYCVLGSINSINIVISRKFQLGLPHRRKTREAESFLCQALPIPYSLPYYNDLIASKEDVLTLFDEAIALSMEE